ncbi:TetR family transcriptional regulator [Mycolicibacterium mucogenicum]|uniref:TetR/AcrR family transcriptional regulator n=1 Tax=Mycolicibacterium TaxID=1866885 RepID=UPI00226AAB7D|nr:MULTISPECIES: TetR/AcrR family transcriptional regulator [Mycolicibacterium]MCX8560575.1 TetR family transcriptional regulator [Mycolicibacterium mucogenicum]
MNRPDARTQLLVAGERLIAESGPAVSLRDVAMAAGQRNNSAVHYHFGSRDGLIEAIIAHRQAPLEQARLALLAEHEAAERPGDDVAALVTILVEPLFDTPYSDGSCHYARFLERVRNHPVMADLTFAGDQWPATRVLTGRILRALGHLPEAVRHQRLSSMASVMFTLLADHERQADGPRRGGMTEADARANILSMVVGLLTAPMGPMPSYIGSATHGHG